MKTMINKFILATVVLTLAFPLMAHTPSHTFGDEAPTIAFRSTSAMVGSGSTYTSTPTLNADGIAYAPYSAASAAAPRGAKKFGPDPDEELDETDKVPVGDGMWIMMICAMVYAVYSVARVYRRKRRV